MTDYTELKRLVEAGSLPPIVATLIAENERLQSAARTLGHLRYTDNGAELWKPPLGEKPDFSLIDQIKAENDALRKEREGKVLVPITPSAGLLMSMAIRSDHALGCPGYYDQKGLGRPNNGVSHARMLECALGDMRKLHEEVVGTGFYSPEKEADYLSMAKAVQP